MLFNTVIVLSAEGTDPDIEFSLTSSQVSESQGSIEDGKVPANPLSGKLLHPALKSSRYDLRLGALTAWPEHPMNSQRPSTNNSRCLTHRPTQYCLSRHHHLQPSVSMSFISSNHLQPCLWRSRSHKGICTITHLISFAKQGVAPAVASCSRTIARCCECAGTG